MATRAIKQLTRLDPDQMPAWLSRVCKSSSNAIITNIDDDDCAVLRPRKPLLVTTFDFLNASPIAVQLGIARPRDLGRLLVAFNVSDLLGSGALPVALLVGITMPHDGTAAQYRAIMTGAIEEATKLGATIIGGDSKLGAGLTLAACAIGTASNKRQLYLRNAAQPGDLLWLSGPVGSAAAAVSGWKGKMPKPWRTWAKATLVRPRLPHKLSRFVAEKEIGNGGTDISDGFGADLANLCRSSGVGVKVMAGAIPFVPQVATLAASKRVPPWSYAFASGGDCQFFVTTHSRHYDVMTQAGFSHIGFITHSRKRLLEIDSLRTVSLPLFGHNDKHRLSFQQEVDRIVMCIKKQLVSSP